MPRHLFKQYTPDHHALSRYKSLSIFGQLLSSPMLWHFNRHSVAGAFAVGLFWAMIPVPFQMLAAAASAIALRVNFPLSIVMVWISNPLTMPPIFYFNYRVGLWLLSQPHHDLNHPISFEWLMHSMDQIWKPLYLGSVVVGLFSALIASIGLRLFWRCQVVKRYRHRHDKRPSCK